MTLQSSVQLDRVLYKEKAGESGVGNESVGSHLVEGLWILRGGTVGVERDKSPRKCDWLPENHGHCSMGVTTPAQKKKLLEIKCFLPSLIYRDVLVMRVAGTEGPGKANGGIVVVFC